MFSTNLERAHPDPYKVLGLTREATEDDIKRAYKQKVLETHPDRNPDVLPEKFTAVGDAYEILKDPSKRQEYDLTGRVNDGDGGPGGGFHGHPMYHMSQADRERLFQQFREMQQRARAPPRGVLKADMEVWIRSSASSIHQASRESNIDTEHDERRAQYAGKLGTIADLDPRDRTVKIRVMVSPGRADEVWYGAGAVWDPAFLEEEELEVLISPEVSLIHESSRRSGIGHEFDERRARCAGKIGTVVKVDNVDNSAKVRVLVSHGRADELWFSVSAFEPLPKE